LKKNPLVRAFRKNLWRWVSDGRNLFLMALLLAASVVVTWQFARQQPVASLARSSAVRESGLIAPNEDLREPLFVSSRPIRPAYAYSVIPGGVGSGEELREIADHDPVVAQHFLGFDYQHAHLITVAEKQLVYVAYRKGDNVYWTRKKMPLHPGETLISDGKITARTRCGNRVAVAPLGAPSLADPLISDLDQPLFSDELVTSAVEPQPETYPTSLPEATPNVGNALQPVKGNRRFFPPFLVPLGGLPGGSSSPHPPLAVAPEPGTILLFSSGLAGVLWKVRKSRGKR